MPPTSEFVAVLRDQVEIAKVEMLAATDAGQVGELYRHSARLLDLLDRAARDGVDARGWVGEAALSTANATCTASL